MTQNLSHISLFSGIGGINLACDWAGFTTILNCEIDPFCRKVLTKHWPKVPIIGDIRDVRKENVANAESRESWQQETRDRGEDTSGRSEEITLITGGFPCQPFSVAGKRRGKDDDRFLWPEMLRVISEFKPTWVIGENVFGIINMALDNVCSDLEAEGYEVQTIVLPACGVNAPHRRYRVFIVAHAFRGRQQQQWGTESNEAALKRDKTVLELRCEDATDTNNTGSRTSTSGDNHNREKANEGREGQPQHGISGHSKDATNSKSRNAREQTERERRKDISGGNKKDGAIQWAVEPELGRVAHGIPKRVDRLKCLGNAIVPQVVLPIMQAIKNLGRDDE